VVVSPAASADAAPSAARTTPSTTDQAPRRIGPVCPTDRRLGEIGPKSLQVSR
jgi:hypothetical protein